MSLAEWQRDSPEIETDDHELERTYRQSLLDLAALRVLPDDVPSSGRCRAAACPGS